jgi:hypothetical protein
MSLQTEVLSARADRDRAIADAALAINEIETRICNKQIITFPVSTQTTTTMMMMMKNEGVQTVRRFF